MFLGVRGTKSGANVLPRLFLKNATNANLINITTTGVLYADKMDFCGNKENQTTLSGVNCIYLQENTSSSYVGANALFLNDCIVRKAKSSGIFCEKNRNGGRLLNTLLLENDNAGFVLFGSDWYCNFSEFGSNGGANLYTNFGASNDFILCDFYYPGQNEDYTSSKSNIYVGNLVNALTISSCQINSSYHHGIECAASVASAHYIFSGNQFGGNGLAAVNTYSNVSLANNSAVIDSNVHWDFGQKPKFLIETNDGVSKVCINDSYKESSYVTAVTNDSTKIHRKNNAGISLGDGGYYDSRKSANDRFFRTFLNNNTNENFSIDAIGIMRWGSGDMPTDLALFRGSANVLMLGADDCFKTGSNVTGSRPSATVGIGCQFFDTTLSKPIWSDGSNWRDAVGNIV